MTVDLIKKKEYFNSNVIVRIIKVRLAHADDRKIIIGETKTLKEAGDAFKNIYVRKDVHPLANKEFRRLKEVEK